MSGQIRIGDAEREAAVAALGEHYASGRLSKDEYDERSGAAYQARTSADLAPLFADLPGAARQGPRPTPPPSGGSRPWPQLRRGWGLPVLPVLIVVLVAVGLLHVWPLLLVLGVLWCLGAFRGHRRWVRRW